MVKIFKNVLLTLINIIKYPFLGLFFVVYKILYFIFSIVKYLVKGILFVIYLPIMPFVYIFKKLRKKIINKAKLKKQQKLLKNEQKSIKKEQLKISKKEKRNKKLEEKQRIKEEKRKRKEEIKFSKKEQKNRKILEKQRKKEELRFSKQEKRNKKLEEKQRIKKEKLLKQQQLKEQKKQLKLEQIEKKKAEKAQKLANDERTIKKQKAKELKQQRILEKKEKRRLLLEEKEARQRKKLENKAALELQKEQLKEEKLIKQLEEKEIRKLEKEKVKQAKRELRQQRKQLKFGQRVKAFLKAIILLPVTIGKAIAKKFQNLPFIRNARNKRDINRQALMLEFEGKDAEKNPNKIVYVYEAKNPDGKIVKERFAAYSKVEVHSFLLSEGYEVYSIKTNPLIQMLYKENGKVKFKTKDLIFFLTQLSTYLKAGIPLVEALKILARQYKQRKYKDVFRTIIYDLSTGESFSSALTKQGATFPRLLINMIKAAELTGELSETLDDMAEYYTETNKTKKQMINAITYPIIILFISVVVITFILIFVIPKFTQMYASIDPSKIPAFTRVVMSFSDFIKQYILFIIIGIIVFIIIFAYLYKYVKIFRTFVQWILMHIPVVGNVIIYNEVTMFTKTFSSLLMHNVYITDSMEILNKITNNEIYKMIILDTVTNLAKGEKISLAFKDHWAFPIPAYEMLVTGESTGQLAEMMYKVSVYYQDLHKDMVTKIKTFLEPILLIFLTAVVGIIVLAIVIPMFNLYETIQQI